MTAKPKARDRLTHLEMRELRRRTGMSQNAFAEALGVGRRTVEDWEAEWKNGALWLVGLAVERILESRGPADHIAEGGKMAGALPIDPSAAFIARAKHFLDLAEQGEDADLEGAEGAVWPVEALRVAYAELTAQPCASHKAEGIALDPCCPSCEAPAEAGEDDGAWIIYFDDRDRELESFSGFGAREAAQRRYEQVTVSWNAHLFERVKSALPARAQPPAREDALRPEQKGGA